MKTLTVRGKSYPIYRSDRQNKKFKVFVKGKWVHFGAKGYKISPGTKRGNLYCTRSYFIKGKNDITSANFWSRKMWKCKFKRWE